MPPTGSPRARTPRSGRPHTRTSSGCSTRPPNVEGVGEVTLRDLVRQALRMRPDRLVVGEVRGAEVVDLLAALNTGHDGGAGRCTPTARRRCPRGSRPSASPQGLGRTAVHSQAAAALAVVVHVRLDTGRAAGRGDRGRPAGRGPGRRRARLAADGRSCPARDRLDDLLTEDPEARW